MWHFDQPPNCATMTSSHVMSEGKPITRAYHDESDHGWQFYSEEPARMESAMIVALSEIVDLDPGVMELWDLPPGWMALRSSPGAPWHRSIQFADAAQIHVDWSQIASEHDFYDAVLPQCGSPSWHGRNLNALRDSWITGGIDRNGPPYSFVFDSTDAVKPDLRSFCDTVLRVAQESVDENGGRCVRT